MINIEIIKNSSYFGKWYINSLTKWQKDTTGFDIKEPITKEEISYKLEGKYIKLTCGANEYFALEKIKGKSIQFISSAQGNKYTGDLSIYKNKPNVLYINPTEGLIDMKTTGELFKRYIIKVVDKSHQKVEYHGLIFSLIYKKSETQVEFDFKIDIDVSHFELKSINFLGYTVDISFFSVLLFMLIYYFCVKQPLLEIIDYAMIAVTGAYVVQIALRSIYIRNTWINHILKLFKEKESKERRKSRKKFTKKGFEEHIFSSYRSSNN